jgi:chemotaxis signal transduction protein
MRYLTFLIGDVRLGIKVDAVSSVRKGASDQSGSGGQSKAVALARALGITQSAAAGQAVIVCRKGNDVYELKVDRVLDLENVAEGNLRPWPSSLNFIGAYEGIILVDQQLFFTLNLDNVAGKKKR